MSEVPATPAGSDESQAGDLVFSTHVPGADVPPRAPATPATPPDLVPSNLVLPRALVPEGQGVGLHVDRREGTPASRSRVRVEGPPAAPAPRPATPAVGLDSAHFRPPTEPERDRFTWFLPVLARALVLPFAPSSLIASFGGGALLAGTLLLVEASPHLGALALLVVLGELAAIRLKTIRESAAGRPHVAWPDWNEGLAAISLHAASLLLFAPALVLAVVAWGPAAWDRASPTSIPATVRRTLVGDAERALARAFLEAKKGASAEPRTVDYLLDPDLPFEPPERRAQEPGTKLLEELAATAPPAGPTPPPTPGEALARAAARARFLVDPRGASGAALAARLLLLAGAFLFPVGLLIAARVQNPRAVLDPPALLRPIVRAPLAYALVLALFVAQDALVFGLVFCGEPLARAAVSRPFAAHALALVLGCGAALTLTVATGAAVGGFARGRRVEL